MLRLFELDWGGGGGGGTPPHPLEHPRIVLVIIFFIFHMVTVFLVLLLLSPSPLFLGPNVLFSPFGPNFCVSVRSLMYTGTVRYI